MTDAEPFDLLKFTTALNQSKLRYLLIGRWAVAYYGAPIVTADFDFWIPPEERARFIEILATNFDAELPPADRQTRPLLTAHVGPDQIDCFSPRRISNREGEILDFDTVYRRSRILKDETAGVAVRVPSLDDLIALKKFDPKDSLKHQRNLEDIRFLLTLKKHG